MLDENVELIPQEIDIYFELMLAQDCSTVQIRNALQHLKSTIIEKTSVYGVDIEQELDSKLLDVEAAILRYKDIEQLKNWVINILQFIIDIIKVHRNNNVFTLIDKVRIYINENFRNEELTLTSVAEYFNLTPQYLSLMFKNECEENFLKYLTALRLDKAKELLRTTSKKVYEIGQEVGYSNYQYFCTVFKRKCRS